MDFSALPSAAAMVAAITSGPDHVWAALASAVTTLALALTFVPRRAARGDREAAAVAPGACDFLVHGGALQPLTEPARALLAGFAPGITPLAALRAQIAIDCPDIDADLEGLILFGTAFRRHCHRTDGGAVEIIGAPRGAASFLSVRPASEEARALRQTEADLRRAGEEVVFLRSALDRAPVLAWSLGADGQIAWANAGYRDRFAPPAGDLPDHRVPNAFDHVIEEVPLTARAGGGGRRRRVATPGPQDGDAHWFEVSETEGAGGEHLGFALDADDLVASEASLRRFIETLTETFAHLPIGLAVFDKNRRLGLFNPALTDLVKIDAVWLAGRPSLRDFLERLRETRQMPEQKDFAAWRRKLTEIEEGAREGAYEENWVLPSGKVFRVTGRPHPQGALAFLFEDISTAIQLERRYRSELELSQATLDRMAEAVAVFDTSGMLVFVNSAFEALWGLDPMARLDGPGVVELTGLWAGMCRPSPVWARLRDFATGSEARASWSDAVETRDGRTLHLLVAPLPDASALVVFRSLGEERAALAAARSDLDARAATRERDALIEDLAQAQIEHPIEAAIGRILAEIPAARSPEAFQALTAAAQGLKDGLEQARALRDITRAAPEDGGPAAGLTALLTARGLRLELAGEASVRTPAARRTLWAVALAGADLAAPGGAVSVVAQESGGAFELTATMPSAPGPARSETASLKLARAIVGGLGGELTLLAGDDGDRVAIRVTLKSASAEPEVRALRA